MWAFITILFLSFKSLIAFELSLGDLQLGTKEVETTKLTHEEERELNQKLISGIKEQIQLYLSYHKNKVAAGFTLATILTTASGYTSVTKPEVFLSSTVMVPFTMTYIYKELGLEERDADDMMILSEELLKCQLQVIEKHLKKETEIPVCLILKEFRKKALAQKIEVPAHDQNLAYLIAKSIYEIQDKLASYTQQKGLPVYLSKEEAMELFIEILPQSVLDSYFHEISLNHLKTDYKAMENPRLYLPFLKKLVYSFNHRSLLKLESNK